VRRPVSALVLCLSDSLGGLELHVRDHARWLARRSDARLSLALRRGGPLHEQLAGLGAPTFLADSAPGALPLLPARRLAGFARAQGVAVIHSHDGRDTALAALAARLARTRLVLTRHLGVGAPKRDPWHRFVYRAVDRCLTVSDFLAAQARAALPMDPARIECIHLGTAPEPAAAPRAADPARFVVGMVARILRAKGQHELVPALALLRGRGVPAEMVVAGQIHHEAYWRRVQDAAREAGVPLRALGFVSPAAEAYAQLDVAVVASRDEALGLATIEAMRLGVPVVAARSGATPEIVEDGASGLLYEPGDAAGLAAQLERLWREPALRERLAAAGAGRAAREFDFETQSARIWDAVRAVAV
jgi:glycosyltransferase involved in cell wall biosynthesis